MSRTPASIEGQMDAAEIRKAACIIAVQCRRIVQGLLLDSEIADADAEFSRIAEKAIRQLSAYKSEGK